MGSLLEKMERGTLVDKASSDLMLQIMRGQLYRTRIPRYVTGYRIPHKTGDFLPYVGDDVGDARGAGTNDRPQHLHRQPFRIGRDARERHRAGRERSRGLLRFDNNAMAGSTAEIAEDRGNVNFSPLAACSARLNRYILKNMAAYLDSVPFSGIIRIRDMMYSVADPFRLDQGDVSFDAPDTVKAAMTRAIAENKITLPADERRCRACAS